MVFCIRLQCNCGSRSATYCTTTTTPSHTHISRMSGTYSDCESDSEVAQHTSYEDAPSASIVDDAEDEDSDEDEDEPQVTAAVVVNDDEPEAVAAAVRTPSKAKGKKKRRTNEISRDNFEAAQAARLMLVQAVPRLPLTVSETHTVRSFGRLRVEKQEDGPLFSSTSALYPIGFSCDRFEFSPVHGRILKLRCTILDGHLVQEKQRELKLPVFPTKGPIFRIMWGEGIDDESEAFDYPYNPYSNSSIITNNGNPKKPGHVGSDTFPEEGMRVRVRYEHDQWYTGTIRECVGGDANYQTGEMTYELRIAYDDGSEEQVSFPDPDISLYQPGSEDSAIEDGIIELTEVGGKPVTSVVGHSPIHAWGKALAALGLIDEITLATALEALNNNREQGMDIAKDNFEAKKKARAEWRARQKEKGVSSPVPSTAESPGGEKKEMEEKDDEPNSEEKKNDNDGEVYEPHSEKEKKRRREVEFLKAELEKARQDDREAAIALSDARISYLGPFMCNPFQKHDTNYAQEISWLTTVVRREKHKMGSTGSKKKIIMATDLLERNNSFFNPDIETLVEGLPGSECCSAYVFQASRAGGAAAVSSAWIHEAKLRQEREREKQKEKKAPKEVAILSVSSQHEKDAKRKEREDLNNARKKQKQDELDQKKAVRAQERLTRLSLQVDERLFKEACVQRERVVVNMQKFLMKEFAKRRKAAELIASQSVLDSTETEANEDMSHKLIDLSPLGKVYDEVVLRLWDFFFAYGEIFLKWGYLDKVPTLDNLQTAIDALRDSDSEKRLSSSSMTRTEASAFLNDLAIVMCKPISVSLTRVLFASLIALNPALQKDFGAAFFAEIRTNADTTTEMTADRPSEGKTVSDLLPVTKWTWQEIARLAFLSDITVALGYQKHESAHLLRGYRSGGHPNSREAKRLKKNEEFNTSVLRQNIVLGGEEESGTEGLRIRISAPSKPSASASDWDFYLHNIKGLSLGKKSLIKKNITACLSALDSGKLSDELKKKYGVVLHDAFAVFENSEDKSSDEECKKAKDNLLKILNDFTGEHFSSDTLNSIVFRDAKENGNCSTGRKLIRHNSASIRQRMGLHNDLVLGDCEYEELLRKREQYMEDALQLKEDMERKDNDDEDEEGSDDEDGDKNSVAVDEVEDGTEKIAFGDECGAGNPEPDRDASATASAVATVVENSDENIKVEVTTEKSKIGKVTPHDDFCGDIPQAPELLRRCLAVLRTLSLTNAAEPFLYPVDPQSNPGYYEAILQPMCLREAGKQLQETFFKKFSVSKSPGANDIESCVASFARNLRLIGRNCSCYSSAGPMIIAAGDEMLRIFERLFLDWVIAPNRLLPPLDSLDDDRCVDFHESDEEAMVLLCDGCEGKYNMSRLQPPLREVPKGDWFCPRCVSGRIWEDLDPRIGKEVFKDSGNIKSSGKIKKLFFIFPEKPKCKPRMMYEIDFEGKTDIWTLDEVDKSLSDRGDAVDPVCCIEAIAESPGYGRGTDRGLYMDLVPSALNPRISDNAAKAAIASSVYRSTLAGANTFLLAAPGDFNASEWLLLFDLLLISCASSEMMLSAATKMEVDTAESMAKVQANVGLRMPLSKMLPLVSDDEGETNEPGSTPKVEDENGKVLTPAPRETPIGAGEAMVIDAGAVEVVSNVNVNSMPHFGDHGFGEGEPQPNAVISEVEIRTKMRQAAFDAQEKRQKTREDAMLAFAIKAQLRPTIASFEIDTVSQVVDSTLAPTDPSLQVAPCRCRGLTCDFCGLSDVALGSPLVRVPNAKEWKEIMPHSTRSRKTLLVAETFQGEIDGVPQKQHLMAVKIRVGGELFSNPDENCFFDGTVDGGLLAFLPRNVDGFQDELAFRAYASLPFVTGSLSAHECCAVAAHNSRKERVVQEFKELKSRTTEVDSGNFCGRTLALGRDYAGRSYWQLKDKESLFVGPRDCESKLWRRYSEPDVIASVISSLGDDPITFDLKRSFPQASLLLHGRKWSNILQKRQFDGTAHSLSTILASVEKDEEEAVTDINEEDEPYNAGEEVLVESKCGKLLWDAKVVSVSQSSETLKVTGYRVRYKKWSSRFDEWVEPSRVVEPNDNNLQVQEEMLEEMIALGDGVPEPLENMLAKQFLRAKDRARGTASVPDLLNIASATPAAPSGEKAFAIAKAALLLVEASLPIGAVDNSNTGAWRPLYAAKWRKLVENAEGPCALTACAYVLEESITPEWIDQHIIHMLSCLPVKWKAIRDATVSNVALRIALLDKGLNYEKIDKTKFRNRARK